MVQLFEDVTTNKGPVYKTTVYILLVLPFYGPLSGTTQVSRYQKTFTILLSINNFI